MALLPFPSAAADVATDLSRPFWAAIDDADERALRKLVHPASRSPNLMAYLSQYVAIMNGVRKRYPDVAAYAAAVIPPGEMKNYDRGIPGLFKDQQLDVYPVPADSFLQLTITLDAGPAEVDVLPIAKHDAEWLLVFPSESIAWPGLEQRFHARLAQQDPDSSPVDPMPVHVEMPQYPDSMARSETSGCARFSFTVDGAGIPQDLEVVQSEPSGLPGREARNVLRKWRFAADNKVRSTELTFVFLAQPSDVDAATRQAVACGGELESSFLVSPTGTADPNRLPQFQQQAAPARRY